MLSRRDFFCLTGASVLTLTSIGPLRAATQPVTAASSPRRGRTPNIVYILADDMGYGDVHALGGRLSGFPTPHIDQMISEGMTFLDAHSGSSVCTPTRYGILTGRYCWRTRLKRGVHMGWSNPPLIEKTRMTVPSYLRSQGYDTAAFGKWHLGIHFPTTDGKRPTPGNTDYSGRLDGGPTDVGFDRFEGCANSMNQPPFIWVNNDRFVGKCTTVKTFQHTGPAEASFEAIEFLPKTTQKTVDYILEHGKSQKPFFIYMALSAPHTPIVPSKEFQGKSGINPYADLCMQVDDTVGKVLAAVKQAGLDNNTLIIFTSDNGCDPKADVATLRKHGHHTSGGYRGLKFGIYEGGHRMPFVARWPGTIKANVKTRETICLTDLLATVADLTGGCLPDNAGEDSVSILPILLGEDYTSPLREATVHHSSSGAFAIRQGKWKLCLCSGSSFPGRVPDAPWPKHKGKRPPVQLFDVENDPHEDHNVCLEHPEIVKRLTTLLVKYKQENRSVPHRK